MTLRYTDHAREQMTYRDIGEEDVMEALDRVIGDFRRGTGKDTVTCIGKTASGTLGIALRDDDREVVVSVWWR